MNWKEIKEKCPKALHKYNLYNWDGYENYKIDNYAPIVLKDLAKTNNRNLYDFFDENGIRIALTIDNQFGYEIYTNGFDEIEHSNIGWFYHRIEAETEAFNKAFEILENKLT